MGFSVHDPPQQDGRGPDSLWYQGIQLCAALRCLQVRSTPSTNQNHSLPSCCTTAFARPAQCLYQQASHAYADPSVLTPLSPQHRKQLDAPEEKPRQPGADPEQGGPSVWTSELGRDGGARLPDRPNRESLGDFMSDSGVPVAQCYSPCSVLDS